VQKGHKSEGHNAAEGVALTVRGGQDGMLLPGAQHGEAAGWVGRMHDHWHAMRVICGLDNTRGVEEFVEGGQLEEGKTQDEQHMHGYDLNHIDLGA